MDFIKISCLDEFLKEAEGYDFDYDYDVPDTDVEESSLRFHNHIESLGKEIVLGLDLDDLSFLGQKGVQPSDTFLEAMAEFEDIIRMEYQDMLEGVREPSEEDIKGLVKEYFTTPAVDHFKELSQKKELETTTFSETVRREFYENKSEGFGTYLEPKDSDKNFQILGIRDNGIVVRDVSIHSDGKAYLIRDEVLDKSEANLRIYKM